MQLEQYVVLAAVIAGITELISRIRARDYWVVATILCAAVVGGLFGASDYYPGLDAVEGVVAGFGAAGGLKALSTVGNKSTPAPSKVREK